MLQTVFLIEQYHYYEDLFGTSTGSDLVDVYALMFALGGVPVALLYGAIADHIPRWAAMLAWDLTAVAFFACTATPSVPFQYASMACLVV